MWKKTFKTPLNYVRYLGFNIDEHCNWFLHINHLSQKLVKANAILCKLHHFVSVATMPFPSFICL